MQISVKGLQTLKEHEGFRANAYNDLDPSNPNSTKAGVWTIGYGTTKVDGKPVQRGQTCTEPEATVWLQADLAWAQTAVNKLVKVPLTQNMFDALVSFVYNIGEYAFSQSTLLRLLNQKFYKEAANEFPKWNKSGGKVLKGLVARRYVEQQMFLENINGKKG